MFINDDQLHLSFRRLLGHNAPFSFIISEREPGKSSCLWKAVYKKFVRENKSTVVLRRQIVDITETYINDISKVINKFLAADKQIKLTFKKGDIKEGIVDVMIGKKLFLRIVGMSCPMSRIKSLIVRNPAYIVMDEFICNTRMGEKYLKDEAFKFKEIYNTYRRECDNGKLRCIFCGNPYSLFNPYFSWLNVDTSLLKPGAFIKGNQYVIQCATLKPKLREKILRENPLYQFDDDYKAYGFDGLAINDANIRLCPKHPQGYQLKYIFRISNRYLCIYRDMNEKETDTGRYWISIEKKISGSRKIFAFDFNNLVNGSALIGTKDRLTFWRLRNSIANRDVTYQTIECSYLIEEIYNRI